jgi:DNA-directed RNA polymerase specialized sigma24 family protein
MVQSDVVKSAKLGDNSAFDSLTTSYYSKMLFYTIKRVNKHEIAQDIVQNTFLKAFTNINTLKNNGAFEY